MASDILHIKDSYYFEIPKILLPRSYKDKADFPDLWVKLDDQFQEWEFERLYHDLPKLAEGAKVELPSESELHEGWHHWSHDHANHGKPFDVYLEEHASKLLADYQAWTAKPDNNGKSFDEFLKATKQESATGVWFAKIYQDPAHKVAWEKIKTEAGGKKAIEEFKLDPSISWSEKKLKFYNSHLSGKILIPQPFGELRNFYQKESGFCVSKFMVVELVVGLIILLVFSWVGQKIASGQTPKGRLWNLLETFLCFIRDQVAAPSIGGEHHDEEHGHDEHGHGHDDHGHAGHGYAHVKHAHAAPISDVARFTPVLWTIFFFVLGCNLFGIVPWAGSPTASFSVTLALAGVTLASVCVGGMSKFGFLGFFANQIPSMDLPWYMAIVLKPMIFAIEMLGLFIKHGVLAIRLLANMVAGHLVILGIMGLAFGATAALTWFGNSTGLWSFVAVISVVSATLFNVLELFVAFLQAYVFTFLSALFIGASVHKH